jgi:hypothetical protein
VPKQDIKTGKELAGGGFRERQGMEYFESAAYVITWSPKSTPKQCVQRGNSHRNDELNAQGERIFESGGARKP